MVLVNVKVYAAYKFVEKCTLIQALDIAIAASSFSFVLQLDELDPYRKRAKSRKLQLIFIIAQ